MKSQYAFALVLLSSLSSHCLAQVKPKLERKQPEIVAANLDNDCTVATTAGDRGSRTCKAVEGYSLLLKADGPKTEIYLMTPAGRREAIQIWNPTDPAFLGLGSSITWEVVHVPKKSIAIVFRPVIAADPDYAPFGGYDVIVRVSPEPVCIVGSVPNGSTSAMLSHGMPNLRVSVHVSGTTSFRNGIGFVRRNDWQQRVRLRKRSQHWRR